MPPKVLEEEDELRIWRKQVPRQGEQSRKFVMVIGVAGESQGWQCRARRLTRRTRQRQLQAHRGEARKRM